MSIIEYVLVAVFGAYALLVLFGRIIFPFKRNQPINEQAYQDPKLVMLRENAGDTWGKSVKFGCGHTTGLMLMHKDGGHILRRVVFRDARNVPCHKCYLRGAPKRFDQESGNNKPVLH